MKSLFNLVSVAMLAAMLVFSPQLAFAKHGNSQDNSSHNGGRKPTRIRIALLPSDPLLVDLASAHGKLRYQSKKRKSQFKVNVKVPSNSTSLGTDPTTLDLHVRLSRGGVDYNDCVLAFSAENEEDAQNVSTSWEFRVFLKTNGRKVVAGSCGNGLTEVQAGDTATVYGVVNGNPVPFLAGP